jgi:xanthosine utilization system XapX-like protein
MDIIFVLIFLATTLIVAGLFVRGFLKLLSFRDPAPPANPS